MNRIALLVLEIIFMVLVGITTIVNIANQNLALANISFAGVICWVILIAINIINIKRIKKEKKLI